MVKLTTTSSNNNYSSSPTAEAFVSPNPGDLFECIHEGIFSPDLTAGNFWNYDHPELKARVGDICMFLEYLGTVHFPAMGWNLSANYERSLAAFKFLVNDKVLWFIHGNVNDDQTEMVGRGRHHHHFSNIMLDKFFKKIL